MKKGLLIVNTDDGKGKSTAALGMAMRSAGHGLKVCFIQFIKGSWKYGEMEAVKIFQIPSTFMQRAEVLPVNRMILKKIRRRAVMPGNWPARRWPPGDIIWWCSMSSPTC